MRQISPPEMSELLNKLISERTPLRLLFVSSSGVRVLIPGFVDTVSSTNGVVISVSGPPSDIRRGLVRVSFDVECTFWYGDTRELPEATRREGLDDESTVIVRFVNSGETLTLFFTI